MKEIIGCCLPVLVLKYTVFIHNWITITLTRLITEFAWADPEYSERGDGPIAYLPSIQILFIFLRILKIIQGFKEKGVAAAPWAHP